METILVRIYLIITISSFLKTIQMGIGDFAVTPSQIREGTNLTIFGSIIVIFIWFIVNPFLFITRFLIWLMVQE